MIEREKPDLVAVCTAACLPKPANKAPDASFRGDSHADLAVAVANLGVPMLFVEKAMASSMERADEIRDAVKRNNTNFNTGVLRRFDNRYTPVKEAIAQGRIGEVKTAIHYAGSSLMHGHIHSIDTLSHLIGDPTIEAVRGELLPRDFKIEGNHIPADPLATYQLRFKNGVEAWSVPAGPRDFEIIGTEGSIHVQETHPNLSIVDADGWRSPDTTYWPTHFGRLRGALVEELAYFADCVRDGRQPEMITPDESMAAVVACLAAEESARTGDVVTL